MFVYPEKVTEIGEKQLVSLSEPHNVFLSELSEEKRKSVPECPKNRLVLGTPRSVEVSEYTQAMRRTV